MLFARKLTGAGARFVTRPGAHEGICTEVGDAFLEGRHRRKYPNVELKLFEVVLSRMLSRGMTNQGIANESAIAVCAIKARPAGIHQIGRSELKRLFLLPGDSG
jgi:hypothetical protein